MTALDRLLDPTRCVLVTMECQRGVIGDLATFPVLREAVVGAGLEERLGTVAAAARSAGVPVVHALAHFRADRAGSSVNAPLLAHAATIDGQLLEGSPAAELVPELGPEPGDLISARYHGVSPFGGTDLDAIVRRLGARTIVAVGVSLNVGLLGLAIEAVNLGYDVVLPTDAAVAVPPDYATAVIRNTFAQLVTLTDVAVVVSSWS